MNLAINTPTFKVRMKNKGYHFAVVVERVTNNKAYRAKRLCFGAIEAIGFILEMKGAARV